MLTSSFLLRSSILAEIDPDLLSAHFALKRFSVNLRSAKKNGWRRRQPLVQRRSVEARSAMSAAARSAAVETTTTGSASATVELIPAAEAAAIEITPTTKVTIATEIAESAVIVAAEITIAGPVAAVETVEPRTHADKNAAIEVFGAVIAVRRASVWVISVVAVTAVGRRTDVSWRRNISRTNSNAYAKSNLGIGGRARENYEKPEQTEIFKISHRQTSYMYSHLEAIGVPKAGEGAEV
jgi:hypothetical protein